MLLKSLFRLLTNLFRLIDFVLMQLSFLLIRIYKIVLSPYLGNHCRFYPTCSTYTYDCIKSFGFAKGSYLGLLRILRCNPLFPPGIDPIPKQLRKK